MEADKRLDNRAAVNTLAYPFCNKRFKTASAFQTVSRSSGTETVTHRRNEIYSRLSLRRPRHGGAFLVEAFSEHDGLF
jgi:hypothetical protein